MRIVAKVSQEVIALLGEGQPWLVAVAWYAVLVSGWPQTAHPAAAQTPPPVESGVYGFSGAGARFSEPEGVIGECIWIYDARDRRQVAKADCAHNAAGKFRVVLPPGHYVLHGPGGNQPIEIKAGGWLRVDSVASLPMAP